MPAERDLGGASQLARSVRLLSPATHPGSPPHAILSSQIQTIGGVKTYVTLPSDGGDKSKVLIYLIDALGLELVNNKVRYAMCHRDYGLTAPHAASRRCFRQSRVPGLRARLRLGRLCESWL